MRFACSLLSSAAPFLFVTLTWTDPRHSPFKCSPDFTNHFYLAPTSIPIQWFLFFFSGYGNLCIGPGPACQYKSLVSQRLDSLRLTCPKQCGKTKNKSFISKSAWAKTFWFPFLPGAALFSLEELDAIACCKIVLIFYLPTSIVTRTRSGVETPFEGVYWWMETGKSPAPFIFRACLHRNPDKNISQYRHSIPE